MFHSLAKVLAIGLLFLAAPLFADTWTDPATGTQWEYSLSNSGEATIGKASNAAGSLTIPSTINGHRVTAIGIEAFQGCTNLTSVNIPDSATIIGDSAFLGCTSLISVTIPDSVTEIGGQAFEGCGAVFVEKWNTAYMSTSEGILMSADGRELLHVPASTVTYRIPDSVTTIGGGAFSGCTSLTSVTIPESVTEIGWSAFSGCTSLTSVTIPDSVTVIRDYAFAGCGAVFVEKWNTAYKSTSEGILMSANGRELLHVPASTVAYTIPASVTGIGVGAFSGCTSLTTVTIPDSVTEIWDVAFEGCTSLTAVTIPASVTEIWPNAFSGCTSLTAVTIPDSVTAIGWGAFSGCTSLTAVTIPDSVTAIGWGAFSGCTSLTSITIPESVTTIGDFSFSDCSNLRHAYLLNKTCKIAPNAFEGSPTEIVFGPPPEEPVPEEMSPSLFWVYVGVGILAVVGVVFLGIWWRKRKARARQ